MKRSTHCCGQLGRKRQREKGSARQAAHRCNVAQSASQTTVPDRIWRMPVAAKMHAFQAEVGGDQALRARAESEELRSRRRCHGPRSPLPGSSSNALDDQFFAKLARLDPFRQRSLRQLYPTRECCIIRSASAYHFSEGYRPKFIDMSGSLCYGLKSFHSSRAPGNREVSSRGGESLTHVLQGPVTSSSDQQGPAFRIFIGCLEAQTGTNF